MYTITEGMLKKRIAKLNKLMGTPVETWKNKETVIGNCCLYVSLGRYSVEQITNTRGGVTVLLNDNTKRGLYHLLDAYIAGYEKKETEGK